MKFRTDKEFHNKLLKNSEYRVAYEAEFNNPDYQIVRLNQECTEDVIFDTQNANHRGGYGLTSNYLHEKEVL